MSAWLVFDAWRTDDPASRNSHWMAQRTVAAAKGESVQHLAGPAATRAGFEAAWRQAFSGGAFFGHGDRNAVLGTDGKPALDRHTLPLLSDRWAHAIACRSGHGLPAAAREAGVDVFVAYDTALLVEWDPDELPPPLLTLLERLTTSTTLRLAAGERDERTLRRAVSDIADEMWSWVDEHRAGGWVLAMAQQFVDRMVFVRAEPGR